MSRFRGLFEGRGIISDIVNGIKERGEYTVPSGLDVALDPFFHLGNVFLGVFEIFPNVFSLATSDEASGRRSAGFLRDGPATVLNSGGKVVRTTICLRVL